MSQTLDLRILLPAHKDALMEFAKRQLSARVKDPMDSEMQSWSARWRGEALDHYLPQGWSFGAYRGEELCGFLLAQPILFFRGLTQTLWIELVESESDAVRTQLIDCAQRWARDKHLQCALYEQDDGHLHEIKTARFT